MQADKVLVIIVTYNAMRWIERCLSSIPSFADIFVVDNGSSDGTQNFIHRHLTNIHFIQSEKNLGFGAANNIGLQYALDNNYDYVYLLNQDAWLIDDALEQLITVQKKHPEYGILSPLQMQADLQKFDYDFAIIAKNNDLNKKLISTNRLMAAHWLISKRCLKKVGGFSPAFHHYGEDDNYIDRALYHGFSVGFSPMAQGVHDRAGRRKDPNDFIFFAYVRTIVFLSDFKSLSLFALYGFLCDCFKFFVITKKFTFFNYLLKIITNYFYIKRIKALSKKECAFLISQ